MYIQRLENYLSLKAIAEKRRGLVFLNSIGSKYYSLLANLTVPDHSEQHKFSLITYKVGESISNYERKQFYVILFVSPVIKILLIADIYTKYILQKLIWW